MRVFKLELPKNLNYMVDEYTTPELKNEFEIMTKEDEELLTLLESLSKKTQKIIYTKLVGFFEEGKVFVFRGENVIIETIANSFVDLINNLKKYNKTILDSFSPGCGEESYIFLHTITFIKICVD